MKPQASHIFYGALTLFALACLGWGMSSAGAAGAAFGLFAFLTLGGALVCIWERSVVRSAFALMATFMGVSGLFLILGADFLAMAQILIYVGGILALILFGVMLTPPDLNERKLSRVLPGLVLVLGGFGWVAMRVQSTMGGWAVADELPPVETHAREIGIGFLHPEQYLVPFELAAFLLTVALVGAVYIARRRKEDFEPEREA
jgi:NADH-quinone oxidoreductase subunit J